MYEEYFNFVSSPTFQLNRVMNMSAEKSSKKGFAILFVGVMIGIGVGIAACVTTMVKPVAATADTKAIAVAAKEPAKPLPSLYPPPPQTAFVTPEQPAQQSAPNIEAQSPAVYQQPANTYSQGVPASQGVAQGTAIQSSDGSLLMPGVNAYATTTPTPVAATTNYETSDTITAGHVNPNWTVGRNGLMQNPCVDPPSAHGRQTGPY